MAISWDTQITNVNVVSKRADVIFVRTDDATGETWTHRYTQAILETTQQRTDLLDAVWSAWEEQLSKQGQIDTFVGNLEQSANANLMAREA